MGYEEQKNGSLNTQIERYFAIKIRPSLKMQTIIKQRSPSGQLFETVKFAFIKFFDLLVILGHLSCFWEICTMCYSRNQTLDPGRNV